MYKGILKKVRGLVLKALVDSVLDDKGIQLLKVSALAGETIDKVERVQNFGVTSNPPKNSETIIIHVGAAGDHPVAIAVDCADHRPKDLEPGETALYNAHGDEIRLKKDGGIYIKTSGDVTVDQAGSIFLGGSEEEPLLPLSGVVTGECLDPVTGVPFPDKSLKVFAKKA